MKTKTLRFSQFFQVRVYLVVVAFALLGSGGGTSTQAQIQSPSLSELPSLSRSLPTPEHCFSFLGTSATILDYHGEMSGCPNEVIIPKTI